MGISGDAMQITIGSAKKVTRFTRNDAVMNKLEDDASPIDACFLPNLVHYTGRINIHDIAYGNDGLWVTNSNFSCLSLIETGYSFVPKWKPDFIDELNPTDKCHLNGMAMLDGEPAYVSCFRQSDLEASWRSDSSDGAIIDVRTQKVIVDGLSMPHSPTCWNGDVYFCESGEGYVSRWSPKTRSLERLFQLPGFPRGLRFYGPLLLVATSLARYSDIATSPAIADYFKKTECGIWIFNTQNMELIAKGIFNTGIEQIYDIEVLDGVKYPLLVEEDSALVEDVFGFPPL
jgi:uncharacterized protein (TIGR03032 family)